MLKSNQTCPIGSAPRPESRGCKPIASEEAPPLCADQRTHDLKRPASQARPTNHNKATCPSRQHAARDDPSNKVSSFDTGTPTPAPHRRPTRPTMALAPTPPTPAPQRPTMRHSSAFLLPPPPSSSSSSSSPAPGGGPADATVALVVLNQPLPRFAPLLWSRGKPVTTRPTHPRPGALL
jgi:hypothetical protein